ncbi:pitrilysin family protein [Tessaracoccus defluvii]|uniref:M16 family metallopeptidase n=1 Tax=Tessaracoccus defluvii TaxID=1285901 RepID=UPI0031D9B7CD
MNRPARPAVSTATPWHFPVPTTTRLPNGLNVWHFPMPGQHIATFELVLPAPLSAEPADREGLATVALHTIDEGTTAHPDGRIGELLEGHGCTLHGTARYRYTTFGGQAPSRRLGDVLPLFAEVLTDPTYAERDLAHHVEAQVAGFDSLLASPRQAMRLALRRALFGEAHREGRPGAGTPATLGAITRADAVAWHAAHFTPGHASLVVAGAVDLDDVLAGLDGWFPDSPAVVAPAAVPPQPRRVLVVDQPGSVQATATIATRTVTRDDPHWPALRLAGHSIAGAFASRLNLELRERLGYTYGIGGGFSPGVDEGQFAVSGSFRSEVAGDAVARLLAGLALDEAFTPAEISDSCAFLVGVAPLANETSADIVAQGSALAAAGLGPDYLPDHFSRLAAVTAEEATDAFRAAVAPDATAIAIAGDAATLLPQLAALGLGAEVIDLSAGA